MITINATRYDHDLLMNVPDQGNLLESFRRICFILYYYLHHLSNSYNHSFSSSIHNFQHMYSLSHWKSTWMGVDTGGTYFYAHDVRNPDIPKSACVSCPFAVYSSWTFWSGRDEYCRRSAEFIIGMNVFLLRKKVQKNCCGQFGKLAVCKLRISNQVCSFGEVGVFKRNLDHQYMANAKTVP